MGGLLSVLVGDWLAFPIDRDFLVLAPRGSSTRYCRRVVWESIAGLAAFLTLLVRRSTTSFLAGARLAVLQTNVTSQSAWDSYQQ